MTINNTRVERFLRSTYTSKDIDECGRYLTLSGAFQFPMLPSGLYPAAHVSAAGHFTRVYNVWVRDSVHIAHAHWVIGETERAVQTIRSLLAFYAEHRQRFDDIISGRADPRVAMNRPHVRFDGSNLTELEEAWAHAQNDALGYLLWLSASMAHQDAFRLTASEWQVLTLIAQFLCAIRYWEDEDSGHWEGDPKIEASSIGTVVAGLRAFEALSKRHYNDYKDNSGYLMTPETLADMIDLGRASLHKILPNECIQPYRERAYDAALLFLIYPLNIVERPVADHIIHNVERYLKGDFGIRRYLLDSFWCANYDEKVPQQSRNMDVLSDTDDRHLRVRLGEEAQWCIFDPILSVIYGKRYMELSNSQDRGHQTHYFNRSLCQLTGPGLDVPELRCPELYYELRGDYRPSVITPFLWTQANLLLAFEHMRLTAAST